MTEKDMLRSSWTRVTSRKQMIRDYACGEYKGKISLLKILELSSPFKRSYGDREIVLADAGYWWLQLAIHQAHAWFTVMFDDQGRLVEIYVDVTDGNDALKDNPTFEDMYLDYVVADGKIHELDREELEEAFSSGVITKIQYETALAEGAKIRQDLTEHTERITAFFTEQFGKLKQELDEQEQYGV